MSTPGAGAARFFCAAEGLPVALAVAEDDFNVVNEPVFVDFLVDDDFLVEDAALEVDGAGTSFVKSMRKLPKPSVRCSCRVASVSADEGVLSLIAHIKCCDLSEGAGLLNANLGLLPVAAVNESSLVALCVGVTLRGISWSLPARWERVIDPSLLAHIMTI